jgi:hypothetical protein
MDNQESCCNEELSNKACPGVLDTRILCQTTASCQLNGSAFVAMLAALQCQKCSHNQINFDRSVIPSWHSHLLSRHFPTHNLRLNIKSPTKDLIHRLAESCQRVANSISSCSPRLDDIRIGVCRAVVLDTDISGSSRGGGKSGESWNAQWMG